MRSKNARWVLLAIALLATAMIAAGCGGNDKKSSSDTSAATQAADTGSSDTSGAAGGDTGGASSDPNVQAAVKACEQQIDAQAQLSDSVKTDLKDLCQKAASGDAAAQQAATKEVCLKIVEETVPAGAAQDAAKSACESAGP